MKATLILMLTLVPVGAQTSDGLRKRYGAPVSQTYLVRPGVTATVSFAKNGEVCKILVEPERRLVMRSSTPRITSEQINEIIDEIVPPGERGEQRTAGFVNAGCLPDDDCRGTSADFERVHIYYNGPGGGEYRFATVEWKGVACQ
jgi:hypothetical protein